MKTVCIIKLNTTTVLINYSNDTGFRNTCNTTLNSQSTLKIPNLSIIITTEKDKDQAHHGTKKI